MILILDNDKVRRHDVWLSLYMKKYIVAEQSIDDASLYTKPNMTVYIDPSDEQIEMIRNEDTITVIATNKLEDTIPDWIKVVPLNNKIALNIIEIFEECCQYGKGRELFGVLGLEGKQFAYGGKYINMTPRQINIIKLFLYNSSKTFARYDASSYFDFDCDKEDGFISAIEKLNNKCKVEGRERLILSEKGIYWINKDTLVV